MDLTSMNVSYEYNRTICHLLYLTTFTKNNIFWGSFIVLHVSVLHSFLWLSNIVCVYTTVCLSVDGYLHNFFLLAFVINAHIFSYYGFVWIYAQEWAVYAVSYGSSVCRFLRNFKLPTSTGSSKKQEISRKTSVSALLPMPKPLTVWITINCGKFFKRWEYQNTWPASWEIYMQVRKQQLELDMEQLTGSK